MTGAEIAAFLSQVSVPMRLSFASSNGLLVVPLWFHYSSPRLLACSPRESVVVRSLQERPEVAFDISTNDVPYKGVRGRGLASCLAEEGAAVLDAVLARYVDDESHSLSRWLRARVEREVAIAIAPSWLTSWDFSERMRGLPSVAQREGTGRAI